MTADGPTETTRRFERLMEAPPTVQYTLKLFVSGMTPRSHRAIGNLQALCDRHLAGRYHLEIVDLYQDPARAEGEQILAAPTLVKLLPAPSRRVVGDLSDTPRLLRALDLREAL